MLNVDGNIYTKSEPKPIKPLADNDAQVDLKSPQNLDAPAYSGKKKVSFTENLELRQPAIGGHFI